MATLASAAKAKAAVKITISPTSATLTSGQTQQFTATVTGNGDQSVLWSTSLGSVSSAGLYTAPSVAVQTNATVTATSVANNQKFASAIVTINPVPIVGISISPTSASVLAGGQQQFTALITGTANTAVTWSKQGNGTVSSIGLYAAPTTAETDIVTATSQADTSKSASASVTVTLPVAHSVSLSWTDSDPVTFNAYRSTTSGSGYQLISRGLTSPAYVDSNVKSGATYYYVVTAFDGTNESSYSNEAEAIIP